MQCEVVYLRTFLPDGRVLTTGGTTIKFQVGPTSADIDAYSLPYLFRGVRPELTALSVFIDVYPATRHANLLPLGWYMLFGMVDDVPSEGLFLHVDP